MEGFLNFVTENYTYILIVGIVLIVLLIVFLIVSKKKRNMMYEDSIETPVPNVNPVESTLDSAPNVLEPSVAPVENTLNQTQIPPVNPQPEVIQQPQEEIPTVTLNNPAPPMPQQPSMDQYQEPVNVNNINSFSNINNIDQNINPVPPMDINNQPTPQIPPSDIEKF